MTAIPEIPFGAIENGRVFLQRLADHYDFTCEAGSLANCTDYHEAVRCFEFIAQWISELPAAPFLQGVKVKAWGWVIPRGGSKKPIILEASKFDQASAAAEADIHDFGYFPVYTHPALASSDDIDPARTEGFRQGIDAAAKLADYFEETIYSEGMSEDVYYGISCTVSQIAREIRALHPVADKPDEAGAQGEGWLPIESAPKDGKIDIWATDNDGKGRRVTDCYYDRICDEWRTSAPALRLHCVKARYVTHWRPLPTPPSGEVA